MESAPRALPGGQQAVDGASDLGPAAGAYPAEAGRRKMPTTKLTTPAPGRPKLTASTTRAVTPKELAPCVLAIRLSQLKAAITEQINQTARKAQRGMASGPRDSADAAD